MSDILKLKYKVGEIEFEAEGPTDAVEQQRINFMDTVLPAAVQAMIQTQITLENKPYITPTSQIPQFEASNSKSAQWPGDTTEVDYSRTSLPSFLKKYGTLNDQDFTLFAAYFDEQKNGIKAFSVENVKQYYLEGRRQAYSNNSELLRQLAKKGYVMDTPAPEGAKSGKYYMLTDDGINYINTYTPKEDSGERKKPHPKTKKVASSIPSTYATITADDLNLKNYPAVKSLSGPKEKVIMAMYIVVNEGKGEWFTVDDVIHLLVNIFEVPANSDMINTVFKRNKGIFYSEQDPNNKKALRRKLLAGAKDFAASIMQDSSEKQPSYSNCEK